MRGNTGSRNAVGYHAVPDSEEEALDNPHAANLSKPIVVEPNSIWQDLFKYRRTYTLTAVASFGGMLFGWDTGLIGGVLTMPSFQKSFALDPSSSAFATLSGNIVAVLQAGCFLGAAASFYLSDRVGRKNSLLVADGVFLLGSLVQTACPGGSLGQLYFGRVVGGFGVGVISAVVPMYIGENAEREVRGRCVGCMQLFNVTGIMLSYFVNYGVNESYSDDDPAQWRIPFALQMIPGVLLLAGLVFQNESPRWLVEKNRIQEARQALAHVRGRHVDDEVVNRELDEIVDDFNDREKMSIGSRIRWACSHAKYTTGLAVMLMFWQQWTGTNSINYYSPQIFRSVGLTGTSAGLFATGIYGIVKVVVTSLGLLFATEQLGRKWSLILGGLGQAFAMFYIGANQAFHPPQPGQSLDLNSVFAIICVYLFVVFYSFGWGPIPFVLSAECAPNQVRSFIMASALMTQWLFNFIIAKLTPLMLAKITYATFLLFGTCCILMVVFTIFFVPETSQVPLESIHLLFGDDIVGGATRDTFPRLRRARGLRRAFEVAAGGEAESGEWEAEMVTGREEGKGGGGRFERRAGNEVGAGPSR